MSPAHRLISKFCVELGSNPLLVQGAGGNVSWKEDDILWIKGSGTWLANAEQENIFVPVDLIYLKDILVKRGYDIKPQTIGEQAFRPSIETILHAIMPQKIVAHLHMINALSHLVQQTCDSYIQDLFEKSSINPVIIKYHKPGPELANAMASTLKSNPSANVVLLRNHGIVVGGESTEKIKLAIDEINYIFTASNYKEITPPFTNRQVKFKPCDPYIHLADSLVQQLALNPSLFKRLEFDWALFPDHVVFLGPKAFIFKSWENFFAQKYTPINFPELLFIENIGVFVKPDFNMAKIAQLRCYYDVISRVAPETELSPLSQVEVDALLNWDEEKLRQKMSIEIPDSFKSNRKFST
jgi:rhamnose utilization protein RhaD (predicted bifunctional aldolase and dehydrogenase)